MLEIALPPFGNLVARDVEPRAPEIRRQPRLGLECADERMRIRERFPDLRQKRGTAIVELDHHAVDAGPQLRMEGGFAIEAKTLRGREQRDLDRDRLEFG